MLGLIVSLPDGCYQIMLHGDRGTDELTTCLESLLANDMYRKTAEKQINTNITNTKMRNLLQHAEDRQ